MGNTTTTQKLITKTQPDTGHTSSIVESKLPCPDPECGSSDGYHTYSDGHGYCFACKKTFNNKSLNDTGNFTYEYLSHWNISDATFRKYGVKTKIDVGGKPVSVGFVYPNKAVQVRKLSEKEFYTIGDISHAGLFGADVFTGGGGKHVVVAEGAKDALSLYEALPYIPVVAVQSASTALRDCTVCRSWLNEYENICFALDNDQPGREALAECARLFDYNKVSVLRYRRKDANEHLEHGEAEELRQLFTNARRYLPDNIVSSFDEFKAILTGVDPIGVPYPYPTLQSMTLGMRPYESVLITAQEGVGKTEFMHTLEYQVLKETDYNVAAIFLEEPKRDHLRALARLELGLPVHLPEAATNEQILLAVQGLVGCDDRFHLYSHFGSDDPKILLDTIRFLVCARRCQFVFLDHITMVVAGLAGEDERLALDFFSTRLEMMVKELGFSLILVSHVNDNGLTRGSRLISKNCDVRIDLARDVEALDEETRMTTFTKISKNRPPGGKTGPSGLLVFDPSTGRYKEKEITQDVEGFING